MTLDELKLVYEENKQDFLAAHLHDAIQQITQLEAMIQQAAEDAFDSEVVQTQMLEMELEANPWIGARQYKEDWVETWLCGLQEETAGKETP